MQRFANAERNATTPSFGEGTRASERVEGRVSFICLQQPLTKRLALSLGSPRLFTHVDVDDSHTPLFCAPILPFSKGKKHAIEGTHIHTYRHTHTRPEVPC
jgi:hypothetical protein